MCAVGWKGKGIDVVFLHQFSEGKVEDVAAVANSSKYGHGTSFGKVFTKLSAHSANSVAVIQPLSDTLTIESAGAPIHPCSFEHNQQ